MAKLSFWLDKRARQDGTRTIKFRIFHQNTFYISSDISILEEDWDDGGFIHGTSKKARLQNVLLRKKYDTIDRVLMELEDEGKLRRMDDKRLRAKLTQAISNKPIDQECFSHIIERYMQTEMKPNTRDTYRQTLNKVNAYDKYVCFTTMNADWLDRFDNWMRKLGLSLNSRSIHMRNLRTVFNYAIDQEWTDLYPFRRYKIKQEVTRQECHLSIEQLRALLTAKIERCNQPYADIFLLMLYLCGINAADLLGNPSTHIEGDRLVYTRAKTGKKYSIKIEPEAKTILTRYLRKKNPSEGFLTVTTMNGYRTFVVSMNRALKRICTSIPMRAGLGGKKIRDGIIIEPRLTVNWARHTFATVCIAIGIPKDHVSLCLGHTFGSRITDVYIDYADARLRIDEANRTFLDYLHALVTPKKEK